jgi:hypothetical protein
VFEPRKEQGPSTQGWASGSGDLIVLTDEDGIPYPDWLKLLRSVADARQDFHIVSGPIEPRWPAPPKDWILRSVPLSATFTILPPFEEAPFTRHRSTAPTGHPL